MWSKAAACVAGVLLVGFLTSALAYTEAPPKLKEPWAGYWWPLYHDWSGNCQFCPHLWQGGNFGGPPGPIYNHDTRYFWLPEPSRDSAQLWEYWWDRKTDTTLRWTGHCDGVSFASIVEDQPPTDCGALSQESQCLKHGRHARPAVPAGAFRRH